MKQTAVKWLTQQVKSKEWQDMFIWHKEEVFEQAKEMEKKEHEKIYDHAFNYGVASSQTEISDEEIEKAANEHLTFWRGKNFHLTNLIHADRTINDFKAAIKWYREQLKKKQ